MADRTLFDQVGEATLKKVIKDFYDHVFSDVMIGFFFAGKDKARLVEKEYELAAKQLGGNVKYSGKPLREAHGRHRILGGHFERRVQLLREAMDRHGVPEQVKAAWLAHTEGLRAQITSDSSSECDHDKAEKRARQRNLPIRPGPGDSES